MFSNKFQTLNLLPLFSTKRNKYIFFTFDSPPLLFLWWSIENSDRNLCVSLIFSFHHLQTYWHPFLYDYLSNPSVTLIERSPLHTHKLDIEFWLRIWQKHQIMSSHVHFMSWTEVRSGLALSFDRDLLEISDYRLNECTERRIGY